MDRDEPDFGERATRALESIARLSRQGPRYGWALDLLVSTSPRYSDPRRLLAVTTRVYSQNFEDAMVASIFSRIGFGNRRFVEIGVGRGLENCTQFLLEHLGFQGVWIDADPIAAERVRRRFTKQIADGRLIMIEARVDRENAPGLIPPEYRNIDFLSVDVDQNTSHVWRALDVKARVACVEYNSAFPPSVPYEVPYDPVGAWDGTNVFGGSLKAIEEIGRAKAMSLVGCDIFGINAFLVAEAETGQHFCPPFTAENHFEPPRFGMRGHPPRR